MKRYLPLVISALFLASFMGCKKSEQIETTEEVTQTESPEATQ